MAACYGVVGACLACALAVVAATGATVGQSITIGAGLCSAVACVGTAFFVPSKCCYTTCSKSPTGINHTWKQWCGSGNPLQ
ncbi:MAG: hypothetical protein LBE12_08860 [Planctomycetaceae bacterium]|jgi:hypothetical protein|nr:hypothetical protein [Planctomycetaceae bacterium]